MANKAPGVYDSEVSSRTSVNSRTNSITAIVGTAKTGPLEPTLVYSAEYAERIFGPILSDDFGLLAVNKIVKNSNAVLFIRACHKGTKAVFKDTDTSIFEAKDGGTHLNNCTVSVTVAETNITIDLKQSETVLEKILCSTNPDSEDYIFNVFDKYSTYLNIVCTNKYTFETKTLTVTAGAEGAKPSVGTCDNFTVETKYFDTLYTGAVFSISVTTDGRVSATLSNKGIVIESVPSIGRPETAEEFKARFNSTSEILQITTLTTLASGHVALSGGDDGRNNLSSADIIGNNNEGILSLSDPHVHQADVLIIPGVSDPAVTAVAQRVATNRQNCCYLADPPLGLRAYQTRDWVDARGAFAGGTRLDSSYVVPVSPWVRSSNALGENIFIPPSIAIASLLAYNDANYKIWEAPAGIERGLLTDVFGLEYLPTKDDREIMYTNSVVNPIIYIKDIGYVFFGNKTALRSVMPNNPEPACSLNVRRLVNHIKKTTTKAILRLVFANNDSITWDSFVLTVEPFLRGIKNDRGLYDYEVIMDETTVTPEKIDALEMPGIIRLKPTRSAEVIDLSFELSSSGIKFTDEKGEVTI